MYVPVLDSKGNPLGLVHPAGARILQRDRKARCISRHPFVIKLVEGYVYTGKIVPACDLSIGIDPGVKYTGIAIFIDKIKHRKVLLSYIIKHKAYIRKKLEERAMYRRNRRRRQQKKGTRWSRLGNEFHILPEIDEVREDGTRKYRKEKIILGYKERKLRNLEMLTEWYNSGKISEEEFHIRSIKIDQALKELDKKYYKPKGWLSPATRSRLENIVHFLRRIHKFIPLYECTNYYIEDVRFSPEHVEKEFINPKTPMNSYKREYIFWRDNYRCQMCGYDFIKNNFARQAQLDHIHPRSKGGDNSRENLQLLCCKCNQKKDNHLPEQLYSIFPKKYHKAIDRMQNRNNYTKQYQTKSTQTRRLIIEFIHYSYERIRFKIDPDKPIHYMDFLKAKEAGNVFMRHPVFAIEGYYTSKVRKQNSLPKDHHIDAACVAFNGTKVEMSNLNTYEIIAKGHRNKQYINPDKYGFPRKAIPKPRTSRINGYQSGDLVKYITRNNNVCKAYVSTSKQDGSVFISRDNKQTYVHSKRILSILHKADGYFCKPVTFSGD